MAEAAWENDGNASLRWPVAEPNRALCAHTHICKYMWISYKVLLRSIRASLVAQMVKNLPTVQETWVRFLGQEDPLEEEMATDSGILAWRIPRTEKPGGLQYMWSKRVGHD